MNNLKPMTLKEREKYMNEIMNPPIKEKVKYILPINRRNVCNVIILLLTIYIVLTFI